MDSVDASPELLIASISWCSTCLSSVSLQHIMDGVECPLCHNAVEPITFRRILVTIPVLILWPPSLASRARGEDRYARPERAILVDPLNQATVVPSTNFDGLLTVHLGRIARRILQGHGASAGSLRMPSAPAMRILMAPKLKIEDAEAECSVCLESFGDGGEARELPCNHVYHERCILKWLARRTTCPLCRLQLPVKEPQIVDVSEETTHQEREDGSGRRSMTMRLTTMALPELVVQELQLISAVVSVAGSNESPFQEGEGGTIRRGMMVLRLTMGLPELVSSWEVGAVDQEGFSSS